MMKRLKKISNYLLSLFYLRRIYRYEHVPDFPNDPEKKTVYLLGNENMEWLAGFTCPCGCCEFIELVLLKDQRPNWILNKSADRKVTLRPSVYKKSGCKSHFFLTNGKIEWCKY